ncbi:uncharacterized protein LOC141640912 [Silene latifolia]|uniref:uncharacterized protein LOC141640912 n=1 Tax=Silene latifolia TaxID=37657 RepID=UPI003D7883B1
MGHHCCSKQKVKRGLWSPEEDDKLVNHITSHGHGSWSSVPKLAGLQRCGKSCRLRWINYLRPDLRRGSFTEDEERTIIEVHRILGNRWAQIAKHLPGRTDNEVKNFWNSCIKKKLLAQGLDPNTHNLLSSTLKKSKINNNITNKVPKSGTISSSLAFSVDNQFKTRDTGISRVNQSSFVPDNDIDLPNISFSCNINSTNTQNVDPISGFSTQCFESNNNNLSDVIVDENSLWNNETLRNVQVLEEQHLSGTFDKIGTTQEEIVCHQGFETCFNNSDFDYCFEDNYCSTDVPESLYGDIGSIMEQVAWENTC